MKEKAISRRYGRGLFELALEQNEIPKIKEDLQKLVSVADNVPLFFHAFSDDHIDLKKRLSAADAICSELKLEKTSAHFLKLLIEKRRLKLIELIALEFNVCVEKLEKMLTADISVADKSFSDEIKTKVENILSSVLGTQSQCTVGEDKELLGGFVVRIGDMLYDASVRGKLEKIKERLFQ